MESWYGVLPIIFILHQYTGGVTFNNFIFPFIPIFFNFKILKLFNSFYLKLFNSVYESVNLISLQTSSTFYLKLCYLFFNVTRDSLARLILL